MSNIFNKIGVQPEARREIELRDKAMAGDMVWVVNPSTVSTEPLSTAWTRNVLVQLQTAAGDVHKWFSDAITTGNTIADTSSAGTAEISSTTLTIKDGEAVVAITGDAEDWLGGTAQVESITCTKGTGIAQVESITCTAGVTNAGDIELEVTSGLLTEAVAVAVALTTDDDTVTEVAAKCVLALNADEDVSAHFLASNVEGAIALTALVPAANDATLAFAFTDTDTTLVTFGATADTTAGVAPAAGDIELEVTTALAEAAVAVDVAIADTDYTVTQVAAKCVLALNADETIGANYLASNEAGAISLTALVPAADDTTLAFAFTDTDTTGVTFGSTTETTQGVAKETDTYTVAEATILGYTVSAVTSVETFED